MKIFRAFLLVCTLVSLAVAQGPPAGYTVIGVSGSVPPEPEPEPPPTGSVQLPTTWVNSNEYVGKTTNTINFPTHWTCGATTYPASGDYANTGAGLQAAVNDAETCRTTNGSGTQINIPAGSLFTYSNTGGLTLPQTLNDTSTNFIVLTSTTPLPLGRTVCAHGIQDNVPASTQPGLRNLGCNGSNMSYQLGMTLTPVSGSFTLANGTATSTSAYNDVAKMYTIEYTNQNGISSGADDGTGCGGTGCGPHHYAILNAEVRGQAGDAAVSAPIKFGTGGESAESKLPTHMHIAYVYVHGDWNDAPMSGGVATGPATGFNILPNDIVFSGCVYCSISYSYADKSLRPGSEGHGLSFLMAKQQKIVHNWLEGQSIGSLCGGFAGNIPIPNFMVCQDMEDRGNRYTYPLSWVMAQAAGYLPNTVYTTTGGHGTGATIHLLGTNGPSSAQGVFVVAVLNGGTGYSLNDVLTMTNVYDPTATGGTVIVSGLSGTSVSAVLVVSGSGYSVASNLPTTGGAGTGATVNITSVSPTGGITGVVINNKGTAYAASDNLTVVQTGASNGKVGVTSVTSGGVNGVQVVSGNQYHVNSYVQKNRHEYKFSDRALLDGNIFENGDYSGGQGQAISAKANQTSAVGGGTNYWTTQKDTTITNNIMKNNCSGASGGFRSKPGNGSGGGVSDTVALYYFVNNLMYNIDSRNPGCSGSALFAFRIASDSGGSIWTASVTRSANVATAVLSGSDATANGQSRFHVGDIVSAYACSNTSLNTHAVWPSAVLGPAALAPTDPTALTVYYPSTGPDVTSPATCTISNVQGTPNHFYAEHNSDFGASAGTAIDPSSPALGGTSPCVMALNMTWKNVISTYGGPNAGPVGEGTRTTMCEFDPASQAYHHNAIPGRDTAVVCPGKPAGKPGGIATCYTEITADHTVVTPPVTLWGTETEWCTGVDPTVENCLGVLGNMGTPSFNFKLNDWHNYRLCHTGDAQCNGKASQYAAGGPFAADDGRDMGADFTKFDPAQVAVQYCTPTCSVGSFPDLPTLTIRRIATRPVEPPKPKEKKHDRSNTRRKTTRPQH